MAGTGYSPYTGAGNLATAYGANPNFGGTGGGYGGSTGGADAGGYQYPNNVGGVNYSGAAPSGYAWGANGLVPIGTGQAGIQAYNPAISTSPTRSFQAPTFTNSMSNWYSQGDANAPSAYASNASARTPSSSSDFQIPGSSGSVTASVYDPFASLYAAMGLNSGQRGGTSGGNYPAYGVGTGWPVSGSPAQPFGSNIQDALNSGAFKAESTYGTDPKTNTMDQWGNVGPMRMSQPTMNQYAGGASVFNPAANMQGGQNYLAAMMQQFGGDPTKAYAAYNAGPGFVASGQSWGPQLQSNVGRMLGGMVDYGQNQGFAQQSNQALTNAGVQGGSSPQVTSAVYSEGRYH